MIKFRAWDKKNKSFITNDDEFKEYMIGLDGKFYRMDFYSGVSGHENGNLIWNELKDIILMQYTGLLDKNGKEIFEGDLVQKIHKGKAYQVCEVKFNDGTFVVDDFDANGCKFFWSLRGMQHCWKVIGNVYKNPELIGGGNG